MVARSFAILPKRIFFANRRWVDGKALVVRQGRIAALLSPALLDPKIKVLELPGMALLPGFVNAHTHLEFTDPSFVRPRYPGFVAWLNAISAWKAERPARATAESLARGVGECLAHGTVAVGDHYGAAAPPRALLQSPLEGIVFHECIGLDDSKAAPVMARMKRRARRFQNTALRFGIAPHAPYSVSQSILKRIVEETASADIPISMHIAESKAEVDACRCGEGALSRWIRGKTGRDTALAGIDLFAYLRGSGLFAHRMVAVHMNLASSQDLKHLPSSRVCVITCPKSHEYFAHPPFALEMFLRKHYCVAMGTDSLASNDALNMFEELRMARRLYPRVPLERLWDMATINGARALGMPRAGWIAAGYAANLCAIPCSRTRHPLAEALHHRGEVAMTLIQGKVVWPLG